MLELKFIDPDKIEKRDYQFADAAEIIEAGKRGLNCGLVYPTGTGKTFTAFLAVDHYLSLGKVLLLAHTNPLCEQHWRDAKFIFDLPDSEISKLLGKVAPKKREEIWRQSRLIVATPQTVVSELEKNTIDLRGVSLVVFDEMHMANKKYAYVAIAKLCQLHNIRVLGLTASSGDSERLELIEENYHLQWWLYRPSNDEEVKKFIFPKKEKRIVLDYPEWHRETIIYLRRVILRFHNAFAKSGLIESISGIQDLDRRLPFYRLTELNGIYARLNRWVEERKAEDKKLSTPKFLWYEYIVLYGAYYRLMHLLNLFVTEGYHVALKYIEEISKQLVWLNSDDPWAVPFYKRNAASRIWLDNDFHEFRLRLISLVQNNKLHAKLARFLELVAEHLKVNDKLLIFSNYKSTLDVLAEQLKARGIDARIVAGNAFMKSPEQRIVLDEFEAGKFPVLLATTVVEAGIHVPKIDVVINYSMPLTGIAQIQRGGRAGRTAVGLIYYLIMDNSNDSSLYFAARSDNKYMDAELKRRLAIQKMEQAGEDVRLFRAKQESLALTGITDKVFKKPKLRSRGRVLPKTTHEQLNLFENTTAGGE